MLVMMMASDGKPTMAVMFCAQDKAVPNQQHPQKWEELWWKT